MHEAAMDWVKAHATDQPVLVLDIGGQDINGTPKRLFPNAAAYTVLDITPGPNVDVVADATDTETTVNQVLAGFRYDVVVCTEVLEHVRNWPAILQTAFALLKPGGRLILTAAGPGRFVHSGYRESLALGPGEYYGNVHPRALQTVLTSIGFVGIVVNVLVHDVRAVAVRPS